MSKNGYGSVTPSAFLDFAPELRLGAWGLIHENVVVDVLEAPTAALWKRTLSQALERLEQAHAAPEQQELEAIDDVWNSLQWQMEAFLTFHVLGKDPAKSQAARRLRDVLLRDGRQDEVELGHRQVQLATEGSDASEAVNTLRMLPLLDEIRETTDKLAQVRSDVIVHDGPAEPRHRMLKSALTQCRESFAWVHAGLVLLSELASDLKSRSELGALLEPLDALIQRSQIQEPSEPSRPILD